MQSNCHKYFQSIVCPRIEHTTTCTLDILAKNMITGKLKRTVGEQQPTPLLVDTSLKLEYLVEGCIGWAFDHLDYLFAA